MRAGLPVVASDVGGIGEAVVHGKSGCLVRAKSVEALAATLKALINNSLERERLGAQGRLRYESKFRFERTLSETAALYATIVGKNRPKT
jgi:glycosyltransferase involved in cell wall biosynthesis